MQAEAKHRTGRYPDTPYAADRSVPEPTTNGVRRLTYIFVASLFFTLGIVGVAVPGLPATPFLLLCSYFLARSSPRLHAALLRSRLFGGLIRDWRERRGIRRHVKQRCFFLVLAAVSITMYFSSLGTVVKAVVGALVLIGLFVLWRLPTIDADVPTETSRQKATIPPTSS